MQLIFLLIAGAAAFTSPVPQRFVATPFQHTAFTPQPNTALLRGRTNAISSSLAAALTGAYAVPAAAGISAIACSLAYIRQAYVFSLSYGLSMLGIGGAIFLSAAASPLLQLHAGLIAAYGLRLFAFLFWRQQFQPGYDGAAKLKALDKTPRAKRTPIILSTGFFYALMASPLIFHLKAAPFVGAAAIVSKVGLATAAVGLIYEAVADQQKSLFKMGLRASGASDELYTKGLYSQSRHANYVRTKPDPNPPPDRACLRSPPCPLKSDDFDSRCCWRRRQFGELVFWTGSLLAGLPAVYGAEGLLTVAVRTVCSGLGLLGIYFIMLSATKRLEGKQAEKYRPSAAYDDYFMSSNALMPRLANLW